MKKQKEALALDKQKVEVVEVFLTLRGETLEWLEGERERRGGKEAGQKLQPIIQEKLHAQMRKERRQI